MIIGVPREIKESEYRVGLVPSGAHQLIDDDHQVVIESGAGAGSGFEDDEYEKAGATVVPNAGEVYSLSDMVVKVKEPIEPEYELLRDGQILFCYLHLAPLPRLTEVLLRRRVTGIAYETLRDQKGGLPLLTPMSEVAGRMSAIVGAYYLQRPYQGRGVLLGGIPGVRPGLVVVVGAGTVGWNAMKMAMGLGAQMSILDVDIDRLRHVDDLYFGKVETLYSNTLHLSEAVKRADLVIGAVLIPGASAPKLITREMVRNMKPGSVIVDVAVDQGGCCETSRPTSHSHPVYEVDGVLHYCVTNMPGAMPRTSTYGLTNATLPYVREIAGKGFVRGVTENNLIATGVNTFEGRITCPPVAASQGLEDAELTELM